MVGCYGFSRRVFRLAAAAPLATGLVIAPAVVPVSTGALIASAWADCPDAEVVFARGRLEPPGLGAVGDALVNSLRSQTSRSVGVYGVNWPADIAVSPGANDIRAHVQSMAASCPNTRIVVGGYSLGASAADLAVRSMPPSLDRYIAAVALFGNGARRLGPAPAFAGKTIDQCADGDPICGRGFNWDSHLQPSYLGSGLVDQAAGFIAGKL
ncbi:cutinase family protein [Mycobacterium sp. NPDC048908]|uniref:cutinase family protein n=1 Tax=Mycobacterium sp. NPDC048908 TaxID=3364292 RepID=UPI00371AF4F2